MGTITAKNRKKPSLHQRLSQARKKKREAKKRRKIAKKKDLLPFALDVIKAMVTDGFNTLPAYAYADYRRDLKTLERRVKCEGLYFVVEILPSIAQGMFDHLEGRLAPDHKWLQGPLFKRTLQYALDGRLEYIRFIYQVSVAFKKLEGKYSEENLASQYREFCDIDEGLRDIDWFEKDRYVLLDRVRAYARKFCQDIDPFGPDAVPRPGPGATNTPIEPCDRYTPHVIYQQLDSVYDYTDWFYHNPWAVNDESKEYLNLVRDQEPVSRFKFVPKTARKARGICIEENEVQYLQQGMREVLTRAIAKHPLYSKRIVLQDQSVNGWMALIGSEDRRFATLDASSASDRVARELVSWVFQDNQDLHDCLMALSTRWISPPMEVGGPLLRTAKFAPMGSAVCFPVMSLVFMFIARAAISLSDIAYPHLASTNVFVYGDDVVVPSRSYTVVVRALEALGLKINETKSFVQSYFRESCGVHAYKGVDITPVFVRKQPYHSNISALQSILDTEFQLYEKEWFVTAETLRRFLKIYYPKYFRWTRTVPPTSTVVGIKRTTPDPRFLLNFSDKARWDEDYQCWELKEHCFVPLTPITEIEHDHHSLLRWHIMKPEPFKTRKCPVPLSGDDIPCKVRHRWLPASVIFH